MNQTSYFTFLLAVAVSLGCVPGPVHDVAPLLNEARENEVATYAKYRDEEIRVTGVVLQTGLDKFTRLAGEQRVLSISVGDEQVFYPYILLGDAAGSSRDTLKCYFYENDEAEVGRVKQGTRMVVRGTFHQYARNSVNMMLVLDQCSIE